MAEDSPCPPFNAPPNVLPVAAWCAPAADRRAYYAIPARLLCNLSRRRRDAGFNWIFAASGIPYPGIARQVGEALR
jgi:hypothetical protein